MSVKKYIERKGFLDFSCVCLKFRQYFLEKIFVSLFEFIKNILRFFCIFFVFIWFYVKKIDDETFLPSRTRKYFSKIFSILNFIKKLSKNRNIFETIFWKISKKNFLKKCWPHFFRTYSWNLCRKTLSWNFSKIIIQHFHTKFSRKISEEILDK